MAKEYIERETAKRELLSWAVCMNHPDGVVSWNGKGWVFVYAQRYVTNVTHWMPMPEPPKTEKMEE